MWIKFHTWVGESNARGFRKCYTRFHHIICTHTPDSILPDCRAARMNKTRGRPIGSCAKRETPVEPLRKDHSIGLPRSSSFSVCSHRGVSDVVTRSPFCRPNTLLQKASAPARLSRFTTTRRNRLLAPIRACRTSTLSVVSKRSSIASIVGCVLRRCFRNCFRSFLSWALNYCN